MLHSDSPAEPSTAAAAPAKVYDRASILEFLELAEAERVRLEAALAVAHQRRQAAESARTEAAERSLRAVAALRAATRDLAAERDTTERTIAVILAAAEAEAESIIAEAREAATAILARLPGAHPLEAEAASPEPERIPPPPGSAAAEAEERWLGQQLVG